MVLAHPHPWCGPKTASDLCIRLTWNLTGSCGQQQRLRKWSRMVVKQFQDGGRPSFWKSIYRHISEKNHPILMKFCTQQQMLNWLFWRFNLLTASNTFVLNLLVFLTLYFYIKSVEARKAETSYPFCSICYHCYNYSQLLSTINVNKLQFIHKLTASDTSKTAKITKRWLPISTSPKCQCAAE